jgi:hypothetical protein
VPKKFSQVGPSISAPSMKTSCLPTPWNRTLPSKFLHDADMFEPHV